MTLDELLDQLERVRKRGNEYTARCPAHTDKEPSLSITEGDDRLLVHCHAGCSQDDVLDALGLSWKDIVYDETSSEPEATYPYTDESGNLLYEVVRFPGKQFRQRQANGDWNLNGTRRVLYHLPEVLYGVEQGKTIYVCEGEKDVEALRAIGKVATTSCGGAQSWRDEYAECLHGAHVIIVQDKDDPGRKRAQQVYRSLENVALTRHVVEAAEGKDVYDHLVTHGMPVEALRIAPTAPQGDVLPIKSVKSFAASVTSYHDERAYLGPLLYGGNRVHVAGPIGHGKTTLMLEAESAALRATDFLGWPGKGNLRALHIDLEMPDHLLHRAVTDARLGDVDGLDLLHLPDGLEIDKSESHRQMIEKACEGYDIVCIDPFYKLVENELEYGSARAIIGLLDKLRKNHPRMCMILGFHSQEPYKKDDRLGMAAISGFKFWHRAADIVLTFQRTSGNYSRIVWAKDRPGRLGVSIDEEWQLEWTRGQGFQRVYELGDTHVPGMWGT